MDINLGGRHSSRGIHIYPLYLQARFHYDICFLIGARKTDVVMKFIDNFFIRTHGYNILDMNKCCFLPHDQNKNRDSREKMSNP